MTYFLPPFGVLPYLEGELNRVAVLGIYTPTRLCRTPPISGGEFAE